MKKSIKELFKRVKYLDSDWSTNITQHKNKFYVYFTKIFILSVIFEYKNLKDDEIKIYSEEFIQDYSIHKNIADTFGEYCLKEVQKNMAMN